MAESMHSIQMNLQASWEYAGNDGGSEMLPQRQKQSEPQAVCDLQEGTHNRQKAVVKTKTKKGLQRKTRRAPKQSAKQMCEQGFEAGCLGFPSTSDMEEHLHSISQTLLASWDYAVSVSVGVSAGQRQVVGEHDCIPVVSCAGASPARVH
eukprot:2026755-Prorocentrum_lima.AAC.1